MHPILANPRWLGLYVLGWLPIGFLLTAGLGGDAGWVTAGVFFVPLTVARAFIGLSSWYVCRSFPLERGLAIWRAVLTLVIAAATTSGLWVAAGSAWASVLESLPAGTGAVRLYTEQRPLLTVVGGLLFLVAAAVHYLLMAFQETQEAARRAIELQLLARNAELKALRTQIDPHFLFNSLHSISALVTANAPAARRMCVLLGDFLRDTLRLGSQSAISLGDELSLVERYLAIEQVRLGPRLEVIVDAERPATECQVPPLLLQPVVENAVVHGVRHLLDGGLVRLTASREGEWLHVSVTNPCDPARPKSKGTGLGLELLRKRLATEFGSDATVRVTEADGQFHVTIHMPARCADGARRDD